MSTFCGDAVRRRALARVMFSGILPSSGLNCKQAIRMLRKNKIGQIGDEVVKWSRGEDQKICSPG